MSNRLHEVRYDGGLRHTLQKRREIQRVSGALYKACKQVNYRHARQQKRIAFQKRASNSQQTHPSYLVKAKTGACRQGNGSPHETTTKPDPKSVKP